MNVEHKKEMKRTEQILFDWVKNPFSHTERITAEKVYFSFDLPGKRVNWNAACWSWTQFESCRDLSGYRGIKLEVENDEPRNDAGVYLALRENDGTWYYHPWAAQLAAAGRNSYTALFKDFHVTEWVSPPEGGHFDDNNRFDLDRIDAIAIGIVNPLGIGRVSFSLCALSLIPSEEQEPSTVKAAVSGQYFAMNDTATIPAGLFGSFNLHKGCTEKYRLAQDRRIHHTGISGEPVCGNRITHMMINTIGDRVRPSPRLTCSDWENVCREYGRQFGKKALESGFTTYVEYWNEAYLNWANRNRANFNPSFYDEAQAREGGAVHIRHDGSQAPHLRWTKNYDVPEWQWCSRRDWRRGRDASGRTYSAVHAPPYKGMQDVYGGEWHPESHPPEDIADGEKYKVNDIELTAFTPWHIYDETQFTFWSGLGQLKMYIEPMLAFGEALKAVNPAAVFIVGWGMRPCEDHWAAWKLIYKPVVDAAIHIADGVADHDYGGDPRRLAANYEVLTQYGMVEHNKWLYGYNTETAMGTDPEAYPEAEVVSGGTLADVAKRIWTSRKIMHALRYVPDKARSFSHFGHGGGWFSDTGEGIALMVMRNLRGRMLHVENEDPDVYIVAAIDGTDPLNPRPEDMCDGQELVVAVLNDQLEAREVDIRITAPSGTSFSKVTIREPAIKQDMQIMAESEVSADSADAHRFRRLMPSRHLAVLSLPLRGNAETTSAAVRVRQFFGGEILQQTSFTKEAVFHIAVDSHVLKNAFKARLRFVVERLSNDEGIVSINGSKYALPGAIGPENSPYIREIKLALDDLKMENDIVFGVSEKRFAGYLVASASLLLETRES